MPDTLNPTLATSPLLVALLYGPTEPPKKANGSLVTLADMRGEIDTMLAERDVALAAFADEWSFHAFAFGWLCEQYPLSRARALAWLMYEACRSMWPAIQSVRGSTQETRRIAA